MHLNLKLLTLSATLALAACSSHEEKLCRAHITEGLLNPETASFSDFKAITPQEIAADELLSQMPRIMDNLIPQKGATYYRMRVRADGKLGNKITNVQICAINDKKDNCACISTD